MIRVLMLNFETSYIKRLLHNEHEKLICTKKSFIEKMLQMIFGQKQKWGNSFKKKF